MKLELKHLAPYLPFSLKWMFGKTKYNTAWMSTKNVAVINTKGYGEVEKFRYKGIPKDLKPILRPLSDLTKEIEHNGDTFIPLNELLKESNFNVDKMSESEILEYEDSHKEIDFQPWYLLVKYFEWHFDVFGLIEKGLAIDKNTLNTSTL